MKCVPALKIMVLVKLLHRNLNVINILGVPKSVPSLEVYH